MHCYNRSVAGRGCLFWPHHGCFHIMESVSIPKGAVITSRDTADYTQYTAFTSLSTGEYFFKSYDNSQITTAKMLPGQSRSSDI